jgi:LPS sulfotransferase NodH
MNSEPVFERLGEDAGNCSTIPPTSVHRPDYHQMMGPAFDQLEPEVAGRTLIICSAPRTGSFELCRFLTAAGVGVPHEYIHDGIAPSIASRWGIEGDPLVEPTFGIYMDILRRKRTRGGVFASKLQFWQFNRFLRNHRGIALFDGACVVHLFRSDVSRQFISLRGAFLTGNWDFTDRVFGAPQTDGLDEALNSLDLLIAEDAGFRRLFVQLGIDPIFVTLEEVSKNPKEVVRRIAAALVVAIDEPSLDAMLATSASYPPRPGRDQLDRGIAQALKEQAFLSQ